MDSNGIFHKIQRGVARQVPVKPFWLRNRRGVISFTFDDVCISAAETASTVLARYGVLATYYIAGSWCGRLANGVDYFLPQHLASIREAGHELGCHTFSHLACQNVSRDVLVADWAENRRFMLTQLGVSELHSFAYPFGIATVATKRLAARQFATARGIQPGINRGLVDLSQLRANAIYGVASSTALRHRCKNLIASVSKRAGWAIFYTHDVSENPSPYGSLPSDFEYIVQAACDAGCEVLPVKNALGFVSVPPW
jgi:peptidoglycan/xylan/chitin deacetylase (PgdA/CDA1 family)